MVPVMINSKIKIVGTVGIAVALQYVWRILHICGFHKEVIYHAPGPCWLVRGIKEGSEDIYTFPDGKSIITSGLRMPNLWTNPAYLNRKGRFYNFDFSTPNETSLEIPLEWPGQDMQKFSPHGLSVFEETGGTMVYTVNHPVFDDQPSVEKFLFDRGKNVLQHIKTFRSTKFRDINDLLVVGEDDFFVTNHHHTLSLMGQCMEVLFMFAWGTVAHFSEGRGRIVADSLRLPNGINKSPDNKWVYVASSLGNMVIYELTPAKNLQFRRVYRVGTLLDNIAVDRDTGDLWIGSHPIGWKVALHLIDPVDYNAPSQVIRLKMNGEFVEAKEEIYAEDNVRLSGSTVASYHKGAMIVGTIYHKLMYCQITHVDNTLGPIKHVHEPELERDPSQMGIMSASYVPELNYWFANIIPSLYDLSGVTAEDITKLSMISAGKNNNDDSDMEDDDEDEETNNNDISGKRL